MQLGNCANPGMIDVSREILLDGPPKLVWRAYPESFRWDSSANAGMNSIVISSSFQTQLSPMNFMVVSSSCQARKSNRIIARISRKRYLGVLVTCTSHNKSHPRTLNPKKCGKGRNCKSRSLDAFGNGGITSARVRMTSKIDTERVLARETSQNGWTRSRHSEDHTN